MEKKVRDMMGYKIMLYSLLITALLGRICAVMVFAVEDSVSEDAERAFLAEVARIEAVQVPLQAGQNNDLAAYERFADEVAEKWSIGDKEHYAVLMYTLCKPLALGRFNDDRQYDLATEYALSALEKPDEISLRSEVKLVNLLTVRTAYDGPDSRAEDWTGKRKQCLEMRLHAWKRLLEAVDHSWKPDNVEVLRAELESESAACEEAARRSPRDSVLLEEHRKNMMAVCDKLQSFGAQYRVREMLATFSVNAERRIEREYSVLPYGSDELKEALDSFKELDSDTVERIIDTISNSTGGRAWAK